MDARELVNVRADHQSTQLEDIAGCSGHAESGEAASKDEANHNVELTTTSCHVKIRKMLQPPVAEQHNDDDDDDDVWRNSPDVVELQAVRNEDTAIAVKVNIAAACSGDVENDEAAAGVDLM